VLLICLTKELLPLDHRYISNMFYLLYSMLLGRRHQKSLYETVQCPVGLARGLIELPKTGIIGSYTPVYWLILTRRDSGTSKIEF